MTSHPSSQDKLLSHCERRIPLIVTGTKLQLPHHKLSASTSQSLVLPVLLETRKKTCIQRVDAFIISLIIHNMQYGYGNDLNKHTINHKCTQC